MLARRGRDRGAHKSHPHTPLAQARACLSNGVGVEPLFSGFFWDRCCCGPECRIGRLWRACSGEGGLIHVCDCAFSSYPPPLQPPPPLVGGGDCHLAQKAWKIPGAKSAKEMFYKAPKLIYTVILWYRFVVQLGGGGRHFMTVPPPGGGGAA